MPTTRLGSMQTPVDPTSTAAWSRLTTLASDLHPDLRAWFATDPERASRYSIKAGDLFADLSKNWLTDEVLALSLIHI